MSLAVQECLCTWCSGCDDSYVYASMSPTKANQSIYGAWTTVTVRWGVNTHACAVTAKHHVDHFFISFI